MLKFSPANAKTKALYSVGNLSGYLGRHRKVYSLDLSAGWSCPGAKDCLSKVVEVDGRFIIQDGPKCQFRCFSASGEVRSPAARRARRFNFELLKGMRSWQRCRDLLAMSLPTDCGVLRYHVSGDFFKLAYLRGALALAKSRPDVLFYGYTKSLHLIPKLGGKMARPWMGEATPNFLLTASQGGKYDHLIKPLQMRKAKVVFSDAEAGNLPIDHDDSHAATSGGSFALLIHGTQPAKSDASKALVALKGKGSYARK